MSLPALNNKADPCARAMIADDSSVVRGLTPRWLEADLRIKDVKPCTDGAQADGKNGAGRIAGAGGRVIVADEATRVVWGMPGAATQAGHAEAVKPLKDLTQLELTLTNGDVA